MTDDTSQSGVEPNTDDIDDLDIFGIAGKNTAGSNAADNNTAEKKPMLPEVNRDSGITIPQKPGAASLIQPEKEVYYQPRTTASDAINAATLLKLTSGVTLCGRFILGKSLSQTANLQNWFASDIQTGATVTVHIPLESIQHDKKQIDEIRREYESIVKLQHPHIAPLIGTFTDVNFGFIIVRTYVTGKTLNEYRRDYIKTHGKFPVSQAVRLLEDIASALDYANGHGIVHGEVRPSNIVVSPDKGIQVTNFQLPFEAHFDPKSLYVSPEEKWDGYTNAKSNQYVLAVIAYELLSGQRGASTADMDFTPLPLPEIPDYVINAVRRAASRLQDERYENCREFIAALELGHQEAAAAVQIAEKAAKEKTFRSSPAFWAAAVALFIAVTAAAAYYLSMQPAVKPDAAEPAQVAAKNTPEQGDVKSEPAETDSEEPEPQVPENDAVSAAGEPKPPEAKQPDTAEPKADKLPEAGELPEAAAEKPKDNKPDTKQNVLSSADFPQTVVKELTPEEFAKKKREETAALTRKDFQDHPDHNPDKDQIDTLKIPVGTVSYTFCWIPPCPQGFTMGSPDDERGHEPEELLHRVVLSRGFYLQETEVTQGLWETVMKTNPSGSLGGQYLPVENVSWDDCQQFIAALNARNLTPAGYQFSLPTEAQWEYACRTGQSMPFSFGFALNGNNANCDGALPYDALADDGMGLPGQNVGKSRRVKSYLPNVWGLYDMHGNVWEWCCDWFDNYPAGTMTDPTGPEVGMYRVQRGGCWGRAAVYCRSASRKWDIPDTHQNRVGLRLAVVPVEKQNGHSGQSEPQPEP
ncbi:MAG: SUMF1/EgtB/PvdO family nonheme iron enzyme [Planctomycetaceae bacterium]|nr:SUMF1/EgtB/PvdO family nonheme iron enzyme [Planctomycetaceae bacterium]